tara:strand:- start:83 stop:316 length:234 start_codon:yes stop_codon:yes gene_type:complete
MNCFADYTQIVQLGRLRAPDTDGVEFVANEPVVIPIVLTEVSDLLAEYDPSDPGALSEATARHLAQTILNALSKFKS